MIVYKLFVDIDKMMKWINTTPDVKNNIISIYHNGVYHIVIYRLY